MNRIIALKVRETGRDEAGENIFVDNANIRVETMIGMVVSTMIEMIE